MMRGVFPTPVGVYRRHRKISAEILRFPHARGGVPATITIRFDNDSFSPRPWGCTVAEVIGSSIVGVFPTPVGVYRRCSS